RAYVDWKYCLMSGLLMHLLAVPSPAQRKGYKYSVKNKQAISHFEKALNYYEYKRDEAALKELNRALDISNKFIEAFMLKADIMSSKGDFEACVENYEKAIALDKDFFQNNYFNLAKAQLELGRYDDAGVNLAYFLRYEGLKPGLRDKAEKLKANADFGAEAMKHPVEFEPINMGENINSPDEEYWPAMTADRQIFVFTRREPESKYIQNRQVRYWEDFYMARKQSEGNWSRAVNLGSPINTKNNEGALFLSPDGKLAFFVACHRSDGKGSCDIYMAKRKGELWGSPVNLGYPVNSSAWESSPSFSSDGKTLYFTSNRGGGKGKKDIWISELQKNGKWSKPVNLEINTKGNEMSPFIHPDNRTLYFTSDGYPGMGKLDLFVSRRQEDGSWGAPVNLGYPINTFNDEIGLFLDASGKLAYIASARNGGYGKLDIYSFEMYEAARPAPVTYAHGRVYDAYTMEPLETSFELTDLQSGTTVISSTSDPVNGSFLVCLPAGKEYGLSVSADGYLFYSEHFSMTDSRSAEIPYELNVPMQPIRKGMHIVLKNVFFETGKYDLRPESTAELEKLLSFLRGNPNIKIEISGHTDDVGSRSSNQVLSENRARAVYDYLVQRGIAGERLTYAGYADTLPIDSNDNPEGRAANRRTEFKITGN
ncbi:MAG: OmpA family protein, partial [Flavobacteriales bacterium]